MADTSNPSASASKPASSDSKKSNGYPSPPIELFLVPGDLRAALAALQIASAAPANWLTPPQIEHPRAAQPLPALENPLATAPKPLPMPPAHQLTHRSLSTNSAVVSADESVPAREPLSSALPHPP